MARISLHPRPRPPQFGTQEWFFDLSSNAGGRVAQRQVKVRYQHPYPDYPERSLRDGAILIVFTIIATALALLLFSAFGPAEIFGDMFTSVNEFLATAIPLFFLTSWWFLSIRLIVRSAKGKAGQHNMEGVVIHTSQRTWRTVEHDDTYELYYVAVDDGTRDVVEGWEVPIEVYNLFPRGTKAEAVVSGDRRYVYMIGHLYS